MEYDDKQWRKALRLADKGRIHEAVQLLCDGGFPQQAAALLEEKGRFKDAAEIYRKAKGFESHAVKCFLKAGLEDEALKVYEPVPDCWSQWDKYTRELYETHSSNLWREYIEGLHRRGDLKHALQAFFNAWNVFGRGNREELIEYFRNGGSANSEPEFWAQVLLLYGKEYSRSDGIKGCWVDRTSGWEAALAFFNAGCMEEAFKAFDKHVVSRNFTSVKLETGFRETSPECFADEDASLLDFVMTRYIGPEKGDLRVAWLITDFWWGHLSPSVQKEAIKHLLCLYPSNGIVDSDHKPLKGAPLYMAQQTVSITKCWGLYEKMRTKDSEIENAIIAYAESIERYDYALWSLERFGRFDEAIRYLGQVPPFLVWQWQYVENAPDIRPEEWSENYRQKLEFKLMRTRPPEKPRPPGMADLDRMLALGEITKEEYEQQKNRIGEGTGSCR